MATTTKETRIIQPQDVPRWQMRKTLPESLRKAAGLLRHKRKALEHHLKIVRAEWNRHAKGHDH